MNTMFGLQTDTYIFFINYYFGFVPMELNIFYISDFGLPDTFQSWFLAIQLHVWIMITATVAEANGRLYRNTLVESMWNDVELKLEKLTVSFAITYFLFDLYPSLIIFDKLFWLQLMKKSTKKQCLQELVDQFRATLINYDEVYNLRLYAYLHLL